MAHIVLFHSSLGLRPGVHHFAEQLRAGGHTVAIPDLYSDEVFKDYEAGNKKWFALGIPSILQHVQAACEGLLGKLFFAGFSNGAAVAEFLAATDPRAQGAILMHGALPLATLQLQAWPKEVPVQVHYNDKDPFRNPQNDMAFGTEVKANGAAFEEFLYPGETHLFADADLPDYIEASARLMVERELLFLDRL